MYDNIHRHGLTEQDQHNLLVAIGEFIRASIKQAVEPLKERIAQLEAKGVQYLGIHQRAAEYKRGDIVTHMGTMWIAVTDVPPNAIPGESGLWQLADKSQQQPLPRKPTTTIGIRKNTQ